MAVSQNTHEERFEYENGKNPWNLEGKPEIHREVRNSILSLKRQKGKGQTKR